MSALREGTIRVPPKTRSRMVGRLGEILAEQVILDFLGVELFKGPTRTQRPESVRRELGLFRVADRPSSKPSAYGEKVQVRFEARRPVHEMADEWAAEVLRSKHTEPREPAHRRRMVQLGQMTKKQIRDLLEEDVRRLHQEDSSEDEADRLSAADDQGGLTGKALEEDLRRARRLSRALPVALLRKAIWLHESCGYRPAELVAWGGPLSEVKEAPVDQLRDIVSQKYRSAVQLVRLRDRRDQIYEDALRVLRPEANWTNPDYVVLDYVRGDLGRVLSHIWIFEVKSRTGRRRYRRNQKEAAKRAESSRHVSYLAVEMDFEAPAIPRVADYNIIEPGKATERRTDLAG